MPALHVVAAELKLQPRGAEIGGHAPERITQPLGPLQPAHRAAHRVADHGVKPGMKFCDPPRKALCQRSSEVPPFGSFETPPSRLIESGWGSARGSIPPRHSA